MPRQSRNKTSRNSRRVPKRPKTRDSRLVEFPEVRGLTVEKVVLSADSDFHCISIRFKDGTDLTVVIDTALTFRAEYSKWRAGNQMVLKRWPVVRSF